MTQLFDLTHHFMQRVVMSLFFLSSHFVQFPLRLLGSLSHVLCDVMQTRLVKTIHGDMHVF